MRDFFTDFSIINDKTGEIVCGLTQKQIKSLDSTVIGKAHYKGIHKGSLVGESLEEYGLNDYFHYIFFNTEMAKLDKYLFRVLRLGTFATYNTGDHCYLKTKNGLSMNRKLLKEIVFVGLEESDCKRTIRYMYDNKIIIEDKDNNCMYINKKYIIKGHVKQKFINEELVDSMTRVFNKTINELYEQTPPKKHKNLDVLIKCIPYINRNLNVICSLDEVNETDISRIHPISMAELSEMLGMGYKHGTKLSNILFSIKLNGVNLVGVFKTGIGESRRELIKINPILFYKGNSEEEYKKLIGDFGVKPNRRP